MSDTKIKRRSFLKAMALAVGIGALGLGMLKRDPIRGYSTDGIIYHSADYSAEDGKLVCIQYQIADDKLWITDCITYDVKNQMAAEEILAKIKKDIRETPA